MGRKRGVRVFLSRAACHIAAEHSVAGNGTMSVLLFVCAGGAVLCAFIGTLAYKVF